MENNEQPNTQQNAEQPAVVKKEITTRVLEKINTFEATGELKLPSDYSAANALKGAMLILEELKDKNNVPVLQACTKNSISQALLKMVVEGLSPLKRQGYFIAYGAELQWSRSYQGSIALAKRVARVKDVPAQVIYEGDEFEYGIDENGYTKIYKHVQKLQNINKDKIVGAYAVVIYENGAKNATIMTIEQIKAAWNQGATRGQSPAHKNFTDEMAKKTVINRACKGPINSSTDALLLDDEYDNEYENTIDIKAEIINDNASQPLPIEPKRKPKAEKAEKAIDLPQAPAPEQPSALQPDASFDDLTFDL